MNGTEVMTVQSLYFVFVAGTILYISRASRVCRGGVDGVKVQSGRQEDPDLHEYWPVEAC